MKILSYKDEQYLNLVKYIFAAHYDTREFVLPSPASKCLTKKHL
ncbi:hypothetical protein J2Z23_003563 [Lederbergia galactosidilyticus]|nr:hypothetical protein [Lederbergia galactosidilytica]